MSKYLIVANWKMNPLRQSDAYVLASRVEDGYLKFGKNVDVVICPPFPYIAVVSTAVKKIKYGAQNTFWAEKGAYTGEVSPAQLRDIGATHVILGHSERRIHLGETDEMVNKKVRAALDHGLSTILCIGESEREDGEIPAIVGEELVSALAGVKKQLLKNLIVCYEPVWAISTGKNARPDTPDSAFRAVLFIRKIITGLYDRKTADLLRIIYGGSVRKDNLYGFLTEGKMQGALVGGAGLDADEFTGIIEIASRAR
ncbi:MAG: triose-phosphate isomerase [Candidatus Sungbacteria bacterium]|nr:triose-phosphate isomerase [Candidatus Sungbacteria bacterium]